MNFTFKEYLTEADTKKYTFGTWKKTVKNIIDDFMGKDKKALSDMLSSLDVNGLRSIARNAAGWMNQEKDEKTQQFLQSVITGAEMAYKNIGSKKTPATASATEWAEFERLMKNFDRHYQKSEDPSIIAAGNKMSDRINMLYKKLAAVDKSRADKIMK